jgi:circadian clock protein KaiB
MTQPRFSDQKPEFGRSRRGGNHKPQYHLRLYITGATSRSNRALLNVKRLCEQHLHGRYSLEVVDIYQQPERAREGQVVASPTLVKQLPLPIRRFIGDMSDKEKILIGLGVEIVSGNHTNNADNAG